MRKNITENLRLGGGGVKYIKSGVGGQIHINRFKKSGGFFHRASYFLVLLLSFSIHYCIARFSRFCLGIFYHSNEFNLCRFFWREVLLEFTNLVTLTYKSQHSVALKVFYFNIISCFLESLFQNLKKDKFLFYNKVNSIK